MFSFKRKDPGFVGVDLGGSVVKVVQLASSKNRAQLLTYGYARKPIQDVGGLFLDHPEEMGDILKRLCKESCVTTNKAITALPASSVFSSIIHLPSVAKNDLKSASKISAAVANEAKKLLPLPFDEMYIDWKPLPFLEDVGEQGGKSGINVLLTGASKKLIKKYMEIFQRAGLELISLETESFALTRSLIGNDNSVIMLVDIGAVSTYITIVDHGIPFLDRTINTAGIHITKMISEITGLSHEQAEQFKFDYSYSAIGSTHALPKSLEKIIIAITQEIRYCFNLYQQDEYGGKTIEKILLTGGSARMPHMVDRLTGLLDTSVFLGDPWARVSYPEEIRSMLQEIGAKFAIAIGLAMRDIN